MIYMSEMDIENTAEQTQDDPVIGPVARFLNAYKDIVNGNTDGWPSYSSGVKAAGSLIQIVQDGRTDETTARKAIARVRRFCTTHRLPQPAI